MAENKKRKKPKIRALMSTVLFVTAACVFLMLCTWKMRTMRADTVDLDAQILQLQDAIAEEKNRQLDERVLQAYYESDAYKEKIAREQFNLIYPGETLYVIE